MFDACLYRLRRCFSPDLFASSLPLEIPLDLTNVLRDPTGKIPPHETQQRSRAVDRVFLPPLFCDLVANGPAHRTNRDAMFRSQRSELAQQGIGGNNPGSFTKPLISVC